MTHNYRDQEVLKQIGAKIREIRLEKGISQENLANECEVDYSQVHRVEMGKRNFNISFLYQIAKGLNVDPRDLLDIDT